MLQQAYSSKAMGWARCFEWHTCFKSGRTSLKDNILPLLIHKTQVESESPVLLKWFVLLLLLLLLAVSRQGWTYRGGSFIVTLMVFALASRSWGIWFDT